jgi:xylulokinase
MDYIGFSITPKPSVKKTLSEYWRQLLADITGKTLDYRQDGNVGPALGAARLAQLAVNPVHSSRVILSQPKLEKRHTPNLERHKAYEKKYHAFKKLYALIDTMEIQ